MAERKPKNNDAETLSNAELSTFSATLGRLGKQLVQADELVRAAVGAERDCDYWQAERDKLAAEVKNLEERKAGLETILVDLDARVSSEMAAERQKQQARLDAEVETYRQEAEQAKNQIDGEVNEALAGKERSEALQVEAEESLQRLRQEINQLTTARDQLKAALAGAVQGN